jgi:hypothetical protein
MGGLTNQQSLRAEPPARRLHIGGGVVAARLFPTCLRYASLECRQEWCPYHTRVASTPLPAPNCFRVVGSAPSEYFTGQRHLVSHIERSRPKDLSWIDLGLVPFMRSIPCVRKGAIVRLGAALSRTSRGRCSVPTTRAIWRTRLPGNVTSRGEATSPRPVNWYG